MTGRYLVMGNSGNFDRIYDAKSFQEALEKAKNDGLKFSPNFVEELGLRRKGITPPENKPGLVYSVQELS